MNSKHTPLFLFLSRLFIGLIFAYAGFTKLMEPVENFRGMLAEYRVLPYPAVQFLAVTVPWFEFFLGVFIILGFAIPWTSFGLFLMCLGFLTVLGASDVLLESAGKECGCFGQSGPIRLTVWQVFIMDLINAGIALKLFFAKKTPLSLDGLLNKHR